jgi:hypothetical protein
VATHPRPRAATAPVSAAKPELEKTKIEE